MQDVKLAPEQKLKLKKVIFDKIQFYDSIKDVVDFAVLKTPEAACQFSRPFLEGKHYSNHKEIKKK